MDVEELPMHKDTYFFGYGIDIKKPYDMANQIIKLTQENQQLKEQLEKEKEVKSKAIGHVNACGGELTKDECKYLLQILDINKGE